MNLKVIFITREGFRLPGARVRCYNFAFELNRYGVKTEILSFADFLGAKDAEQESQMGFFSKAGYNLRAFSKLAKEKNTIFFIQRFNYHAFAPLFASLGNGNKMILDLDDWEMREDPRYYFGFFPSSKAHFLIRWVAQKSVACIAASRFLEDFLRPLNPRVYYLPTVVDTQLFKPLTQPGADKEIILSWIGTFHPKEHFENIRLALESFAVLRKKYPCIYFEILGEGLYAGELKSIVEGFKDEHIRIKSWLNPEEVPAYLDRVHIGLLPVARNTKFNLAKSPTKLFEYMAMAKPTVSSAIGEAKEIIRDGENGFLAENIVEFEKKLGILIEDDKLRARLGAAARQAAQEKYSLEIGGRRLFEIITSS